jgi:predicted nucleotidyltransferase
MANVKLRDRDGIVTKEGIILRVLGNNHPKGVYFCDAEYGSAKIFHSKDPRAIRNGAGNDRIFYKFYDDQGWKFVSSKYPQYLVPNKMLKTNIVGINKNDIAEVYIPQKRLKVLLKEKNADKLRNAMKRVQAKVQKEAGLDVKDFGVFGSMLYGFDHPDYSDIDLLVYGKSQLAKVQETLSALYSDGLSGFRNEFDTDEPIRNKKWRYKEITPKEYVWHQKRKLIYAVYDDHHDSGRVIKAEFEPVKNCNEITNEYDSKIKVTRKDLVKIKARITDDTDAPFIPSVYGIEPLELIKGSKKGMEATRLVSYMEEFRLQAKRDETVIINANLEELKTKDGVSYQLVLTYGPRYYNQVLKVADLNLSEMSLL